MAEDVRETTPARGRRTQTTANEASKSMKQAADLDALGTEQKLESLSALVREKQQEQEFMNDEDAAQQADKLDSVYILLAKKEKDLQLAAELGKVLLERNDELSKANEKISEDYSHKLELLEQEKHKLKRRLDQLDGEYENRLVELQTDCNILKNQLEQKEQSSRQADKEKAKLIDDLVQQNQRLTRELAEATKSEELLSSQLEQLNERLNARLSNRLDHAAQVDALQDEIQILSQRKQDLERRLKLAQNDKLTLSATLEETSDKVLVLENLAAERESKLAELAVEVAELRDSGAWLAAKLESMISLNERITTSPHKSSLDDDLNELSERERSNLVEQLKELRLRANSRARASEEMLQLSQRIDRRRLAAVGDAHESKRRAGSVSLNEATQEDGLVSSGGVWSGAPLSGGADYHERTTPQLLGQLYSMLNNFRIHLQQRREQLQQTNGLSATNNNHQANVNEDSGILADDLRHLSTAPQADERGAIDDWHQLIDNLRSLIEEMPCSNCYVMIGERIQLEKLTKAHAKLVEQLRRQDEQVLALEALKIEQTSKLAALEERCKTLESDIENCDKKPKEEIVALAWKARDEAVARKNATEIALAKARIENMQISSQLMESVQQKGELSHKLAQFEDDIHYMMQRSVSHKFTWEELKADERFKRTRRQKSNDETNTTSTTTVISNFGQSSIMQISQLINSIGTPREQQNSDTIIKSGADSSNSDCQSLAEHENGVGRSKQLPSSTSRNLFANLKANRFNLKFWQPKSSSPTIGDDSDSMSNPVSAIN